MELCQCHEPSVSFLDDDDDDDDRLITAVVHKLFQPTGT